MREPNYRFYAMAFVASSTGLQMLSTAIGWEIFERTGNPLDLGYMLIFRSYINFDYVYEFFLNLLKLSIHEGRLTYKPCSPV